MFEVFAAALPRVRSYASREASQIALASDIDSSTTPATKLAQIRVTRLSSLADFRSGRRS
jgi:hypothetical protein